MASNTASFSASRKTIARTWRLPAPQSFQCVLYMAWRGSGNENLNRYTEEMDHHPAIPTPAPGGFWSVVRESPPGSQQDDIAGASAFGSGRWKQQAI